MVYFDFEPEERYRSTWAPLVDVYENNTEIVVRVELPGVDKGEVSLKWKAGVLTISGVKRRQPSEQSDLRYICVERQYGRFRRDIALRREVDFEKATAEFNDGLLRIRLPKPEERTAEIPIG
jgi:HSP20 family protein